MRRVWLLALLLITVPARADTAATGAFATTPLEIRESDGSPSTFPAQLNVTNGSLTDNADGTATVDVGGTTTTGWTDAGTVVRLTTATDSVGIGDTTPDALLESNNGTAASSIFIASDNDTPQFTVLDGGNVSLVQKVSTYSNVATTGWGVPAIYGTGRSTAQTDAVASVATYTVGAADGSFLVSCNVNVTTATAHSFSVQVDYTDETNTTRTLTVPVVQLAGTLVTAITNVTGAGPYEGFPIQIRCKAATPITIKTTGTFTTLVYNVEGSILQVA